MEINSNLKLIDELEWSYFKEPNNLFASQDDWNQTLLTKINQAGAMLFQHVNKLAGEELEKKDYKFPINYQRITGKVIVPLKFYNIFKSLLYYKDSSVSNRFDVFFVDKDIDFVTVIYGVRCGIDFGVNINIKK